MAKLGGFTVRVSQPVEGRRSTTVSVRAEGPEDAQAKALALVRADQDAGTALIAWDIEITALAEDMDAETT